MISKEIYDKIQKFHFKTRFLANDIFAGQYTSAFKGKGMEFSEVREYQPGDDVRDIDWNVTARYGRPFVKIFHEERELTVVLVVDLSASNLFGTKKRFKKDVIAEVAGLLAFLAIRTNDKVGAILFSSQVDKIIPPKKGAGHVWRLIKDVFSFEAPSKGTSLAAPLEILNKGMRRHAIVFFISDFLQESWSPELRILFSLASKKHDLTAVRVCDPAERILPDVGVAWMQDPESGHVAAINTSDKKLRLRWDQKIAQMDENFKQILSRNGVDLVDVATDGSVAEPLASFFRKRERRR